MKLMKLYYLILQEIEELPDVYGYKYYCREMTRFRMKVVDENMSVRAIEERIAMGLVEELIFAAHNEIKLLRIMKKWRPWEMYNDDLERDKEILLNMASFKFDNPFAVHVENYEAERRDRPQREKPN